MIKKLKKKLRDYKRLGKHRTYLYERIVELHNSANRKLFNMNLNLEVEVIRKETQRKNKTNPYLICKVSKDDLDLINRCRKDLILAKKYRRRLTLINY